jgi:nucleoid-associated protein YgaU
MLHKGAIYWAAALGVVAAAGAGGAFWHYSNASLQGDVPAPAASSKPPQSAMATPGNSDAPPAGEQIKSPQSSPGGSAPPTQPEPSPAIDLLRPQFDIVRVEPTGEALIAGHTAPKAKVSVTDRGQIVAETDADETGQFVILPPPFAPGGHALGLTARLGDGAPVASPGIVGVDVPQPSAKPAPGAPAAVASSTPAAKSNPPTVLKPGAPASAPIAKVPAQPGAATSTLASRAVETPAQAAKAPVLPNAGASSPAKPGEPLVVAKVDAAAPAAGATPRIAISGVAADEAGRMVATGMAPAGAFLRLYLNGSLLANVTAGADGFWSLTVEHGMRGGAYSIRADEIDRTKDVVISRAEVPFTYPEHIAELAPAAKPPAPAPVVATPPVAPAPAQASAPAPEPKKTSPADTPAARTGAVAPALAPAQTSAAASEPQRAPPVEAPGAIAPPVPAPAAPAVSSAAAPAPVSPPAVVPAPTTSQPAAGSTQSASGDAAHAIVSLVDTTRVVPGDSLWAISAHFYGNGLRYTQIYAANATQIRNPRLIYPGQIFVLPQPTPY